MLNDVMMNVVAPYEGIYLLLFLTCSLAKPFAEPLAELLKGLIINTKAKLT
jgi:hypothetical protein